MIVALIQRQPMRCGTVPMVDQSSSTFSQIQYEAPLALASFWDLNWEFGPRVSKWHPKKREQHSLPLGAAPSLITPILEIFGPQAVESLSVCQSDLDFSLFRMDHKYGLVIFCVPKLPPDDLTWMRPLQNFMKHWHLPVPLTQHQTAMPTEWQRRQQVAQSQCFADMLCSSSEKTIFSQLVHPDSNPAIRAPSRSRL